MFDIFCQVCTENNNEKRKYKLCSFLLLNWSLFLKIEYFVQMTEEGLHGNSQGNLTTTIYVVLNKWEILDTWLLTKQRIFSLMLIFCNVYNHPLSKINSPKQKSDTPKEINLRIVGSNFSKQFISSGKRIVTYSILNISREFGFADEETNGKNTILSFFFRLPLPLTFYLYIFCVNMELVL